MKTDKPGNLLALLAQLQREGADKATQSRAVDDFLRQQAAEKGVPLYGKFELTPGGADIFLYRLNSDSETVSVLLRAHIIK